MSFLFTQPQLLSEAASSLAGLGSTLDAANAAAAIPTTSVMAAGADEVSAAMASVFGAHAQQYQAMGVQAAKLHDQFVQAMNASSNAYASAEGANAKPLQPVNQSAPSTTTPVQSLIGPAGGAGIGSASARGGRSIGLLSGNRGSVAPGRGAGAGAGTVRPVATGPLAGTAPMAGRRAGSAGASGAIAAGRSRSGRSFGEGGPGGRGTERDLGVRRQETLVR
ncbi:PE family protein [Mycobacterium sp. Z3061]|uniref:PE family protein n=1 Tax=Mycobacterium sp. Z3061 TaxID=3073562 RepID=UPI002873E710|nr:PE family protein [Mycobacterium sp. Z3061]